MQRGSIFSNAWRALRETLGWWDRDLARCYESLRSLLQAGIAIRQSVEMCDFSGVLTAEEKTQLVRELGEGRTLTDSIRDFPGLPGVDRACLAAGERSGHLPRVLDHLRQAHEQWAQAKQRTWSQLLYPVFLLHAAAFLLSVADAWGGQRNYLACVGEKLLIFYAAAALLTFFLRWIGKSSFAGAFFALPVVGRFRRDLELARFCMSFRHLGEAGVEIVESYRSACASLQSPYYRDRLAPGEQVLLRGEPMTSALRQSGVFHRIEMQILEVGETTGTLSEAWGRLETMLRERGTQGLNRFTFWLTQAIHGGILLWIAGRILGFYFNYYGQLNAITR